jgi:hypothetical protein
MKCSRGRSIHQPATAAFLATAEHAGRRARGPPNTLASDRLGELGPPSSRARAVKRAAERAGRRALGPSIKSIAMAGHLEPPCALTRLTVLGISAPTASSRIQSNFTPPPLFTRRKRRRLPSESPRRRASTRRGSCAQLHQRKRVEQAKDEAGARRQAEQSRWRGPAGSSLALTVTVLAGWARRLHVSNLLSLQLYPFFGVVRLLGYSKVSRCFRNRTVPVLSCPATEMSDLLERGGSIQLETLLLHRCLRFDEPKCLF